MGFHILGEVLWLSVTSTYLWRAKRDSSGQNLRTDIYMYCNYVCSPASVRLHKAPISISVSIAHWVWQTVAGRQGLSSVARSMGTQRLDAGLRHTLGLVFLQLGWESQGHTSTRVVWRPFSPPGLGNVSTASPLPSHILWQFFAPT